MNRILASLLAALALAATPAPAATQHHPRPQPARLKAAPAPVRPALWVVKDKDTTIYLFGTVHALPDGVKWQGPAIAKAVSASDRLVLEVGEELNPQSAQATLNRLGITPGLPPPSERIAPERKADLLALYKKLGVDDRNFANEESWAVALQLAAIASKQEGVTADNGVEPALKAMATGKPVEGLETLDAQFGAFDGLSENDQTALLAETVARVAGGTTRVEPLLKRAVDTPSQTAFDRQARRDNLKNAFALRSGATITPLSNYILIDDVFTTGSTLNSCARVLRQAGALNLNVVTFGHG